MGPVDIRYAFRERTCSYRAGMYGFVKVRTVTCDARAELS